MGLTRLLKRLSQIPDLQSDDRSKRSSAIEHLGILGQEEDNVAARILMNISRGKVLRTEDIHSWMIFWTVKIPSYYELDDQLDCYKVLAKIAKQGNKEVQNYLKTALTYGIHNDTDFDEETEHNHHFFYRKGYEPFMPAVLSFSVVCGMKENHDSVRDYKSGAWQINPESVVHPILFKQAWNVALPIKKELDLRGDDVYLVERYFGSKKFR